MYMDVRCSAASSWRAIKGAWGQYTSVVCGTEACKRGCGIYGLVEGGSKMSDFDYP